MDPNTLTIILFLFASALLLGVEAVKTSGNLQRGFGAGAGAFVLLGLFWIPAAKVFPDAAEAVAAVASSPPSWFILLTVIFLLARERRGRAVLGRRASADRKDDQGGPRYAEVEDLADAINQLSKMGGDLRKEIAELRNQIGPLNTKADIAISKSDHVERFADGVSNSVSNVARDVKGLEKTVDRLLLALAAQKAKLALERLEVEIERADRSLYFLDGEGIEAADWEVWQRIENHWRSTISLWAKHASDYAPGDLVAQIKHTPQESFYGTWGFRDSDLPDADTIHRYKAFCIMRRNFYDLKETVDQAIFEASYG